MDMLEKLLKMSLLYAFCFLNAVDMVQTLAFLRMGIEGNLLVVYNPQLWFLAKFIFAFGLPLGIYRLDVFLESKEDEGFFSYLKWLVIFVYVSVFLADIFYLSLVWRNTSLLGRLLP